MCITYCYPGTSERRQQQKGSVPGRPHRVLLGYTLTMTVVSQEGVRKLLGWSEELGEEGSVGGIKNVGKLGGCGGQIRGVRPSGFFPCAGPLLSVLGLPSSHSTLQGRRDGGRNWGREGVNLASHRSLVLLHSLKQF